MSEEKLDNLIMLSVLGIYPLLPSRFMVGSVTLQSLFLFMVIFAGLSLHFLWKRKYQWRFPYMRNILGIAAALTALGVSISMIRKMMQDNDLGYISFDGEVFLLALIGAFILTASDRRFYPYFFDYIVYSGLLVSGVMLYYDLCGVESDSVMQMFIQNDADTASYMLLLGTTSVLQYCECRERHKSFFYAGSALISFFLLFLTQNIVGIGIMTLVFVAVPILFRPTVALVKRDMQMFFLYLFLLSNIGLMAAYSDFIEKEISYSLQNGVYLEMAMAAGGILFFLFWERIPEGVDTERLVLRRMRKGYQLLFRGLLFLAAAVVVGDSDGRFTSGADCFRYLYERAGAFGALLLVYILAVSVGGLKRNYHPDKPETVKLIMISGVFMVQMFFWEPVPQSYPIYAVLTFFALYHQEERRRVHSIKINAVPGGTGNGEQCGNV